MLDLMEFLGLNAPWQRDAACSWADRDRLGPIVGGEPTLAELDAYRAAAEELCAHCPVIERCAAAGDRRFEQGVWGGKLRYRAGGMHGEYVVVPLIPVAVASRRGRAPVCGGVR